jgi:hypothetical protein
MQNHLVKKWASYFHIKHQKIKTKQNKTKQNKKKQKRAKKNMEYNFLCLIIFKPNAILYETMFIPHKNKINFICLLQKLY